MNPERPLIAWTDKRPLTAWDVVSVTQRLPLAGILARIQDRHELWVLRNLTAARLDPIEFEYHRSTRHYLELKIGELRASERRP